MDAMHNEAPVLPPHFIAAQFKAGAFGLHNLQRLRRGAQWRVRFKAKLCVALAPANTGINDFENPFGVNQCMQQAFDGMGIRVLARSAIERDAAPFGCWLHPESRTIRLTRINLHMS